jgi:hypothetical protein
VLERKLEPSARLEGHPSLQAEIAESFEPVGVESLGQQIVELDLQVEFSTNEDLGPVQLGPRLLAIAAAHQCPTKTVESLLVLGIGRHRLA